jgi:hypothetical protein
MVQTDPADAVVPGQTQATVLLILFFLTAIGAMLVLFTPPLTSWLLPVVYVFPLLLLSCALLAVRLAIAGTAPAPPLAMWLGIFFLVGGPVFDIIATVVHSYDLSDESNPFARALLDTGHDLWFVYLYGGVCQGLFVFGLCALWVGLLRHRVTLVESLRGVSPFGTFFKAVTGGAKLTWRQWLFPMSVADLPSGYHLLWLTAVLLLSGGVYRWYLGLEWFRVVVGIRGLVVALSICISLLGYFTWLWYASRGPALARGQGTESRE